MTMLAALQDTALALHAHAAGFHSSGGEVILANNLPDGEATAPEEVKEKVNQIIGFLKYGGGAVAVGSIIAFAIVLLMSVRSRGGGEEHGKTAMIIAIGGALLGSSVSVAGFLIG